VREGGRDLLREATGWTLCLHEKTSAAAAPRKPKKGAVSSPLKVADAMGGSGGGGGGDLAGERGRMDGVRPR
jgi:hypothetical protein